MEPQHFKIKIKTMLIEFLSKTNSSDLYIRKRPSIRDGGYIEQIMGLEELSPDDLQNTMKEIIGWRYKDENTINKLYTEAMFENKEVDIAVQLPHSDLRARVNIYKSMGMLQAVLRKIPTDIPKLEELGFEEIHLNAIKSIISKREGLVLVTGQTGTGKSTTLASIISHLNENYKKHIVTIEDPVEFKHNEKKCIVTQREVGRNADTQTFHKGLIAALRQAPDIILVGEMRDDETATAAMHAAQTGHLVFATLHTNSAPETVLRIIDMFPAEKEKSIRVSLASSLLMIISQKLVPNMAGKRSLCYEIMINNSAIASLIIQDASPEKKILQKMIESQTEGQIPFNYLLVKKIRDKEISTEKALEFSNDRDQLTKLIANFEKQANAGTTKQEEQTSLL